ncbi:MAG: Gfo/Idh/MocA family oxidoreductase, partial [Clostridia bacterium]
MMKKNLVVIGYGGMGNWHCGHALKSDVVHLLGIYDINPEKRALAQSRGIFAFNSFAEVLADPRVDLLTIATPNDVHKELAIAALDAGKNVISEKPVTLSCADLQAMIDASVRSGKLFTVHQNRRWDVDYLAMKQLYQSGDLGEVFNLESRIHGSRGIPSDWRGEKEYGGGMLYDWGIHLIDQVLQIIPDTLQSVFCRFNHITNQDVDDGFQLLLTFEGHHTAYVEVGTYNFISMPRFYMQGMKGTALISDWREKCKVVCCKHWHESEVVPVQTA